MAGEKKRSLVSTLFIRVFFLLAGAVAVISLTAYWIAKDRINNIYDAELITGAKVLYTVAEEELEQQADARKEPAKVEEPGEPLTEEDVQTFNTYSRWRIFRVWRGSQLISGSPSGPTLSVPPRTTDGFVDVVDKSETWRLYALLLPRHGMTIVVGEPTSVRYEVINEFALALTVPLLLLIPASAGLIWLTLLDGLGALRRLAVALHSKSGSNLSPLDASQWPRDLGGITTAINGLLTRLDRSFRQTLRFTDHAAHELRTPLAGLKLNAQMMTGETDPEQQRAIILRIQEGAERAGALVEQLLTLAHLDSGAYQRSPNDLVAVAKAVLGECAPVAAARKVGIALTGEQAVVVRADALLLKIIIRNLVDNAIKQSPAGREVAIKVVRRAGPGGLEIVELGVTDSGPGIPMDERLRVFERFYRGDPSKAGVGLGLSIVAEAVAQIGASIALETPDSGTGLRAVVRMSAH